MKAVLISIQPKWVEMIASGEKTIEVRKTRPKLETPFKCYIYCTRNNRKHALHTYINSGYGRENFGIIGNWRSGKDIVDVNSHLPAYRYNAYLAESKVIGEFVCDKVYNLVQFGAGIAFADENLNLLEPQIFRDMSCLTDEQLSDYLVFKDGYGWHISDLKIYDKPKELSEFGILCDGIGGKIGCNGCEYYYHENTESGSHEECCCNYLRPLKRPPQSWCYVEVE